MNDPYTAKGLHYYQSYLQKEFGAKPEEYNLVLPDEKECAHIKEGKSIFDLPNPIDTDGMNSLYEKYQVDMPSEEPEGDDWM